MSMLSTTEPVYPSAPQDILLSTPPRKCTYCIFNSTPRSTPLCKSIIQYDTTPSTLAREPKYYVCMLYELYCQLNNEG
jgi:hypothetical protein